MMSDDFDKLKIEYAINTLDFMERSLAHLRKVLNNPFESIDIDSDCKLLSKVSLFMKGYEIGRLLERIGHE